MVLEVQCFRDKKKKVKGIGRRPRERDVVVEWRRWYDCTKQRLYQEEGES